MDDKLQRKLSRRSLLKGAASLAGMAIVVPLALTSREALAGQKASKAAMQYQDKPKAGKKCSTCMQFVPGKSASADGTCKVVAGSISPHGYCIAWSPKS